MTVPVAITAPHPVPQPATEWQNLFGVCAALGEDFGFNPLWLRISFAIALIAAPVLVIGAYVALGVIVLASRLAMPNRKPRPQAALAPVPAQPRPAVVELPLAA